MTRSSPTLHIETDKSNHENHESNPKFVPLLESDSGWPTEQRLCSRISVSEIAGRLDIGRFAMYATLEQDLARNPPGSAADHHAVRLCAMGTYLRNAAWPSNFRRSGTGIEPGSSLWLFPRESGLIGSDPIWAILGNARWRRWHMRHFQQ
jgi:hypothetical protein